MKGSRKIPITIAAGFYAMFLKDSIEGLNGGWAPGQAPGWESFADAMTCQVTGWDPLNHKWDPEGIRIGWTPVVSGIVLHSLANMFGINRAMGKLPIKI